MLYAHSKNGSGERHLLADHLRSVALLSKEMATPFGGGSLCFLAGLWHDVGKADPLWQARLLECEQGDRIVVGVDHKCAGALLAEKMGEGAALLIGLLIQGHHGGLRDRHAYASWLGRKRTLPGPDHAIKALSREMGDVGDQDPPTLPRFNKGSDAELFLRFCYSALVDADSLDTEQHDMGGSTPIRGSRAPLSELWDRYQAFLAEQPLPAGEVDRIRNEIHAACLAAAEKPPGIFRLTVPTGGGKTRSAMAFALRHGIKHGKRRVIVAVPYLTITEQTSKAYRDIFEKGYPDEGMVVLEHHSAAADGAPESDGDGASWKATWRRLTAQNWDAPIVVTTTVQLFESLFAAGRSKTRKLHNIANSVIIIDEAQSLPPRFLSPILGVIRHLAEQYGVTFVLSTATQPAFESIAEFRRVQATEIVADHPRHFRKLRRVGYEWRMEERSEWSRVASWVNSERQALVVVNTKRHAMELLDKLGDTDVLHLSTLLCGEHRRIVVEEVRSRLDNDKPCRLVSTQVVEAGVDVDFPVVFRAQAPLDAIIQAAGRCNREGKMHRGRVVVFKPPDDSSPRGVYRAGIGLTEVVRAYPDFDPDDPDALRRYSEQLFRLAVDSDAEGIQKLRERLDFPEVARRFRLIPRSYDVVVDFPSSGPSPAQLVESLRSGERPAREVLRQLQPWTVSLSIPEAERRKAEGWVTEIKVGRGILPYVGEWKGEYDDLRGIKAEDPDLVI